MFQTAVFLFLFLLIGSFIGREGQTLIRSRHPCKSVLARWDFALWAEVRDGVEWGREECSGVQWSVVVVERSVVVVGWCRYS